MERVVIVGCGAAGITAAENIRRNNKEIEIMMISDEAYLPYYRLKLSKYIADELSAESIYIHKKQWYIDNNINLLLSRKAVKIDTVNNEIHMDDGSTIGYNSLILANGSHCFIPPIKGSEKKGVFTIRQIDDITALQEYIRNNNSINIAVIGGGLLGIEAAYAFRESTVNYNISIVENYSRLLPKQLDEEGSAILEGCLKSKNIKIYKSAKIDFIAGDKKTEYIKLEDETRIPADVVIISAGIRPNLLLLESSDIQSNKGVIVDKYMRTNIKNVFAAGDSAEYNGIVSGIWPVSVEQGRIAGINSIGNNEEYKELTPSNLLQIAGMNVFSAGDITNSDIGIKYADGIYSKLFIDNDMIKGVILMGDTKKGFSVKKAIEEKKIYAKDAVKSERISDFI